MAVKAKLKVKVKAKAGAAPGAAARKAPRPRKAYAANLKTVATDASVERFLGAIGDERQRADAQTLAAMFAKASRRPPRIWGSAIVGYGDYSYVGRSGRSGDWFLGGFSPRKGTLTLYALGGWAHDKALLAKLGRHKLGGGCLYVKRLDDVDLKVLRALVGSSFKRAKALAPKMMTGGVS